MPDFDDELIEIVTRAIDAVADPEHFNYVSALVAKRTGAGMFALLQCDMRDHSVPIIYTSSERRSKQRRRN